MQAIHRPVEFTLLHWFSPRPGAFQSSLVLAACLAGLGLASPVHAQFRSELDAQKAEPGVIYGTLADFPLPKTILFSVGPQEIVTDAEEWARHGVSAFFLDFVAREWSSDIWAADGEAWTIGASDKTFQMTKRATETARRLGAEVFLKVAFDHVFEWFNDAAWNRIENNFRQFAVFARDSGCHGIALDIEYVSQQYRYDWSGYDYRGYSRADLLGKARQRMSGLARVLYDQFPDMVLLTFPECGLTLGSAIHAAWIEEAARRNAPGGVHYCTEYTYRNPNIRCMLGHAALCNDLFHRLLSTRGRAYWRARCSIAAGVWPFGFDYQNVHDPGMALEDFRQGIAASLMISRRYNWIYSHNSREQLLGRKLEVYTNQATILPYLKVLADRQIVTTPKYVALAREVRDMRRRDCAPETGLAAALSLTGPADTPNPRLLPAAMRSLIDTEAAWRVALDYFKGVPVDFHDYFRTQTDWWLLGPFASGDHLEGHNTTFLLEPFVDLRAEYDGLGGKVRWREHHQQGPNASVDLTKVFRPTERVTAYALCWVTSQTEQDAQIRVGTNDAGKMWLGGNLIYDYPHEGTAWLDRDIVAVRLPKGTTPLLLKVTNGLVNWGFMLRITDAQGRPLRNVKLGTVAGSQ